MALTLPVVLLVVLVLLQVLLVVRDQVAVVHAAREAVRVAALDGDASAVRAAARRVVPDAEVQLERAGPAGAATVTVTVRWHRPVRLPLVARLVPGVTLSARQVMGVER